MKDSSNHLWCLYGALMLKPDSEEEERKRIEKARRKAKKTEEQMVKGYDENNFVVTDNIRQRLVEAEMNQWSKLYKDMEERTKVVTEEDKTEASIPIPEQEGRQ